MRKVLIVANWKMHLNKEGYKQPLRGFLSRRAKNAVFARAIFRMQESQCGRS